MTRAPKTSDPTSAPDARLDAALQMLTALIARQVAKDHQRVAQAEDLTDAQTPQP